MARATLSKRTRFEVFKRDKFTCQYCGLKAPDIVLHVDHIEPVANGGSNELVNLITSCFDCNSGKSDRKLDDNSVVEKQRKQLEILQERREQIELMLEWKKSLATFDEEIIDMIVDYVNSKIDPFSLNDTGRVSVRDWLKKFEVSKILEGIDEAAKKYIKTGSDEIVKESIKLFLSKVAGVIVVKDMPPVKKKLAYIKGIARNRFEYWDDKRAAILLNEYVTALRNYGWSDEQISNDLETEVIPLTKNSKNWRDWKNTIEKWINDINNWQKDNVTESLDEDSETHLSNEQEEFACFVCLEQSPDVKPHNLDFINNTSKVLLNICDDCLENEKSNRRDKEVKLLEQLKAKKFSHYEISEISDGFENMSSFHAPEVMASVLSWALQNNSVMCNLRDLFFEELAKKTEANGSNDNLPF